MAGDACSEDRSFAAYGIYHLAGTGETNWSGFARQVLETSRSYGGPYASVRDIATADYPTKARRPANSRLSTAKFAAVFGWKAPPWEVSVRGVVEGLTKRA